MVLQKGDVLISKEPHSCAVKFVEHVEEGAILLVNGVEDEFFEAKEAHLIEEKYTLLCKAADRKDI